MPNARTVIAVLVLSATILAQPATGVLDSYTRARQLVDRAVAAHGGVDVLQAARQMRVRREGYDVWRHQSRAVAPPYDREPFASELQIDLANRRLIVDEARSYPGGTHRRFSFVTAPEHSYYVNHRSRTYLSDDYPPASTQTNNLYVFPQLVLLAAHESGSALRSLGRMSLSSGAIVDAVATTANGGSLTIGIDPETHRLRAIMGVRPDPVEGLAASETEFLSYRPLDGVLMPSRRVTRVAGEITQDTTYSSLTSNYTIPDRSVQPPDGYDRLASNDTPMVRELARGVWLVGGDSAALVVAMTDHMIVIDAPTSTSSRIAEEIARLAPAAPVRYVIPTHHHDDHAPGVRSFAAPGATVVTTDGNKVLFERLAKAPIDVVRGSRSFSTKSRTVEIHDIGPSPHANEMLVAWLPEEGILFSSDLVDLGAEGVVRPGRNNDTTMHFANWLRDRGWRVRVHAGGHGGIVSGAVFEELIGQPVIPQAP